MGNLAFALRCRDGLVLASDTSYNLQAEKNLNIVKVTDWLAVLVEPNTDFGRKLIQSCLSSLSKPFKNVHAFATACGEHCQKEIQGKQIPITGLIFAGINPGDKGQIELRGIHASRKFGVTGFAGNVFGGLNSISRYIDRKMYAPNLTLEQAKTLAAFYVYQSQLALRHRVEDYVGMATLTYSNGFQWVEREETAEIIKRVVGLSFDLKSNLTFLFTESK